MPIHKLNISSYLDGVEYGKETSCYNTLIAYDVPLYDQKSSSLCWAFAQLMIMDSWYNIETSNEVATVRAKLLAIFRREVLFEGKEWNSGGKPNNIKEINYIVDFNTDISIERLYTLLLQEGPLYAAYFNDISGHAIVITGVDTKYGLEYTNNPWGITGVQNYEDFLLCFAGVNLIDGYKLREIVVLRRILQ